MRLSILRRIMEIEESVIRPRRITPSEMSIILHMIGKPNSIIVLLEIRKSQDLGRTSRERQVKPRRKLVNLKIVSYIQTHNKTVIPKIKTKPKKKKKKKKKEEEEKKRKEKKRREKSLARNRSLDLRRTGSKLYH